MQDTGTCHGITFFSIHPLILTNFIQVGASGTSLHVANCIISMLFSLSHYFHRTQDFFSVNTNRVSPGLSRKVITHYEEIYNVWDISLLCIR